jgi:hypothetical protein
MYPPGTIPEGVAWDAVEGCSLSGLLKRLEDARTAADETLREADLLVDSHTRDLGHLWKQICGTAEQWASTPEAIVLGLLRFSRDVRSHATEVSKSSGLSKDIIMNKLPAITVCQSPPRRCQQPIGSHVQSPQRAIVRATVLDAEGATFVRELNTISVRAYTMSRYGISNRCALLAQIGLSDEKAKKLEVTDVFLEGSDTSPLRMTQSDGGPRLLDLFLVNMNPSNYFTIRAREATPRIAFVNVKQRLLDADYSQCKKLGITDAQISSARIRETYQTVISVARTCAFVESHSPGTLVQLYNREHKRTAFAVMSGDATSGIRGRQLHIQTVRLANSSGATFNWVGQRTTHLLWNEKGPLIELSHAVDRQAFFLLKNSDALRQFGYEDVKVGLLEDLKGLAESLGLPPPHATFWNVWWADLTEGNLSDLMTKSPARAKCNLDSDIPLYQVLCSLRIRRTRAEMLRGAKAFQDELRSQLGILADKLPGDRTAEEDAKVKATSDKIRKLPCCYGQTCIPRAPFDVVLPPIMHIECNVAFLLVRLTCSVLADVLSPSDSAEVLTEYSKMFDRARVQPLDEYILDTYVRPIMAIAAQSGHMIVTGEGPKLLLQPAAVIKDAKEVAANTRIMGKHCAQVYELSIMLLADVLDRFPLADCARGQLPAIERPQASIFQLMMAWSLQRNFAAQAVRSTPYVDRADYLQFVSGIDASSQQLINLFCCVYPNWITPAFVAEVTAIVTMMHELGDNDSENFLGVPVGFTSDQDMERGVGINKRASASHSNYGPGMLEQTMQFLERCADWCIPVRQIHPIVHESKAARMPRVRSTGPTGSPVCVLCCREVQPLSDVTPLALGGSRSACPTCTVGIRFLKDVVLRGEQSAAHKACFASNVAGLGGLTRVSKQRKADSRDLQNAVIEQLFSQSAKAKAEEVRSAKEYAAPCATRDPCTLKRAAEDMPPAAQTTSSHKRKRPRTPFERLLDDEEPW